MKQIVAISTEQWKYGIGYPMAAENAKVPTLFNP